MPAAVNYANSQPDINGCCGFDINLATSTIGARVDSDVTTARELLWGKAVLVSQQALSQRFLGFPAELFERVFHHLLPQLLFPLASPTKTTSSSCSHIRT